MDIKGAEPTKDAAEMILADDRLALETLVMRALPDLRRRVSSAEAGRPATRAADR